MFLTSLAGFFKSRVDRHAIKHLLSHQELFVSKWITIFYNKFMSLSELQLDTKNAKTNRSVIKTKAVND